MRMTQLLVYLCVNQHSFCNLKTTWSKYSFAHRRSFGKSFQSLIKMSMIGLQLTQPGQIFATALRNLDFIRKFDCINVEFFCLLPITTSFCQVSKVSINVADAFAAGTKVFRP